MKGGEHGPDASAAKCVLRMTVHIRDSADEISEEQTFTSVLNTRAVARTLARSFASEQR